MKKDWNYVPFIEAVEICDSLRKPINSKERDIRTTGKLQVELYPYYGATGQVGYIDDYITDGEYVLLGEDGAPFLNPFAPKAYIISGKAWVNNHAHVLRSKWNNKFLCYYLNQFDYEGYVSGTTRLKLTQSQMKRIFVPVPSMSEQERVVHNLDGLFSQLENAVDLLNKAKAQLGLYRQAVLRDAFSGIVDEMDLDHVAVMVDPNPSHRTPPKRKDGVPYVGIGDINYQSGQINFDMARKVPPEELEEQKSRYAVRQGDFIIGKIGTIGKAFRLPLPQNYALSANVILIQPKWNVIHPEYLYWQFVAPDITKQLADGARATTQAAFGITKARRLKVKLCDMDRQRQLAQKIDSSMSVCDHVEQTISATMRQAENMRLRILKGAFEP